MIVTMTRHPLQGKSLRVLGRMRRHGAVELLVVLPDGSKTLMPAGFTDAVAAAVEPGAATVGSIEDLVRLAVVVGSLMSPTGGVGVVQDATSIPAKEDSRASDKSVGVRSRRRARGADGGGSTPGGPTRSGPGDCGAEVGNADRQVPRCGRVGR